MSARPVLRTKPMPPLPPLLDLVDLTLVIAAMNAFNRLGAPFRLQSPQSHRFARGSMPLLPLSTACDQVLPSPDVARTSGSNGSCRTASVPLSAVRDRLSAR